MGKKKGKEGFSSTILFVRNLSISTKETDLQAHFGGIGPLRNCLIVRNPETGESRRFAFIHFALAEHAAIAVQSLHKSTLSGRQIDVTYALHRKRSGNGDEVEAALDVVEKPESTAAKKQLELPSQVAVRNSANKNNRGETPSSSLRGTPAMRTVVLRLLDGSELTEVKARAAFAKIENAAVESVVLTSHGKEARCAFEDWATAGRAAAFVHGKEFDACIDALQSGSLTTLIIRNLPFRISVSTVRKAFTDIVPVRNVRLVPKIHIPKNDHEPKSKNNPPSNDNGAMKTSAPEDTAIENAGFGFVEFFTVADAKHAMKKVNGTTIGGRMVAVDIAVERNLYNKKAKHSGDGGSKPSHDKLNKSGDEPNESEDEPDESGDGLHDLEFSNKLGGENHVHDEKGVLKRNEQPKLENGERRENSNIPESDTKGEFTELPSSKERGQSSPEELERTVFVRNVPYECTGAELWRALQPVFGTIEQSVVVKNPANGRSKGLAFVRFARAEDARKAIETSLRKDMEGKVASLKNNEDKTNDVQVRGRTLNFVSALNSNELEKRKNEKVKDDPRNLRLASVGRIEPDSAEGKHLTPADWEKRSKAEREKKIKLSQNPNTFVSDVRLCVRNLPRDMDKQMLRTLFTRACQGADQKGSKNGKNQMANSDSGNGKLDDKTKGSNNNNRVGHIVHCSIVRDEERNNRSKCHGFVMFERPEDALRALHAVNNNARAVEFLLQRPNRHEKIGDKKLERKHQRILEMWGRGRRLIVEFSVEDCRKVNILERIKRKGAELRKEHLQNKDGQRKEVATTVKDTVTKRPGSRKLSRMQKRKRERSFSSKSKPENVVAQNSSSDTHHGSFKNRQVKRRRVK